MKKILALIGVLSLAFGAWATEIPSGTAQYQWDVEVVNTPWKSTDDIAEDYIIFLVDRDVLRSEGVRSAYEKNVFYTTVNELKTDIFESRASGYVEGNYILDTASIGNDLSNRGDGTYDAVAHIHILSDDIKADNLSKIKDQLVTVLYDQERGLYVEMVTETGNAQDFTAKGPFIVVPEPTSGLLLLLGMAGLALKRKRA